MRKLLSISILFFAVDATSQNVGINNSGAAPAASAMLDIVSTDKGLLIPRLALTALNSSGPITAPATALLVYNTATAGTAPNNVVPGYYYWDGTKWVAFSGSGGKDWSLTGNSGTTGGTNFVGTTDGQLLEFRTNNTARLRIANGDQVLGMANGVMGAPFFSWNAEPTTGIWRGGTGILAFSSNGAERLRLTPSEVVINENANAVNFRVESAGNANLFNTASANNVVGFQRIPLAQSVGGTAVNDMAFPFEIGNDGAGALQAAIGWYNGSDVTILPETNAWGFVGNATRAWWRMNSYGFVNVSSKEKKRNITPIVGNKAVEDYVMNSINNMQTYFYKYNNEEDYLNEKNFTKFRPMMHIGTILEESPDYIKDAAFNGIDIYAIGTLALSGVKINQNEIRKIKEENKTISDFGSVKVSSRKTLIHFNEDFDDQIPIITVTTNKANTYVNVVSKTSKEFVVEITGNMDEVTIDWIALARRKVPTSTQIPLDPELEKQLMVDDATKQKLIELYDRPATISPSGK